MAFAFPDRREQFLERPLPSSEESERAILGAILLDNALIAQAVEHLKPEDFYGPLHRRIFNAMISLFEASKKIDPILIGEELKKDGSVEAIGGEMARVEGVLSVHDLHVWTLSGSRIALSAHVVVRSMAQWERTLGELQARLHEKFSIDHVTLQPESSTRPLVRR